MKKKTHSSRFICVIVTLVTTNSANTIYFLFKHFTKTQHSNIKNSETNSLSSVKIKIMKNKKLIFFFVIEFFILIEPKIVEKSSKNSTRFHCKNSKIVKFDVYTRSNSVQGYTIKTDDLSNLKSSPLNPAKKTKVIIHGWFPLKSKTWMNDLRDVYVKNRDYNVIIVDWTKQARHMYFVSVQLAYKVAKELARLLNFLDRNKYISIKQIHVLGFSLGAQIAGITGKLLSGKIGRITGLDPARPLFEWLANNKNISQRLDSSDAIFVDVIHTNGGQLGIEEPIGTVDFFPQGGKRQPGCTQVTGFCNHISAPLYMIQSVLHPEQFRAVRCNSWENFTAGFCRNNKDIANMGENVRPSARGLYFLKLDGKKCIEKLLEFIARIVNERD